MKKNLGLFFIIIISATPFIFWLLAKPLETRLNNPMSILTSIGQVTGLLGISTFALTLILSARIKFFDRYFGGIDKMYRVHHILGVISFLLLLIHPLVLAFKYLPTSVVEAARFLLPGISRELNLGIFSLLLMMVIMLITLFVRLPYSFLKFFHKFFGVAFFLGALHAFLIPSDISENIYLKIFTLILVILSLAAFFYRSILGKFLVPRYKYRVSDVEQINETVLDIKMEPLDKKMEYKPGQFIFINFISKGINREIHPFSISSAPDEEKLKITVKSLGDYTEQLKNLRVGAIAKIEGPYGTFSYLNTKSKNQIWIAGGIGIAPFLGMTRDLKKNDRKDYKIDFYYCSKSKDDMIFMKELMTLSETYPNFKVIPFCFDEKGYLTATKVFELSENLDDKNIFICGPHSMKKMIKKQFLGLKIPKINIHSEEFILL